MIHSIGQRAFHQRLCLDEIRIRPPDPPVDEGTHQSRASTVVRPTKLPQNERLPGYSSDLGHGSPQCEKATPHNMQG